jgi:hypothetical protein
MPAIQNDKINMYVRDGKLVLLDRADAKWLHVVYDNPIIERMVSYPSDNKDIAVVERHILDYMKGLSKADRVEYFWARMMATDSEKIRPRSLSQVYYCADVSNLEIHYPVRQTILYSRAADGGDIFTGDFGFDFHGPVGWVKNEFRTDNLTIISSPLESLADAHHEAVAGRKLAHNPHVLAQGSLNKMIFYCPRTG